MRSHILLPFVIVAIIFNYGLFFNLKTRASTIVSNNCVGIDMGTEPNNYDIVSNGIISEAWKSDSKIPYYLGYDEKFEFIYINNDYLKAEGPIEDRFDLMKSKLYVKADRPIDLQPIFRKNSDTKYSLELDYQCSTAISAIVDITFTLETEQKSCGQSIHWKKECLKYSRPVYSLFAEIEGLHNKEGIHTIYRNGRVSSLVGERDAERLDKMNIENAIELNFKRAVILQYWTKADQTVKDLIRNNDIPDDSSFTREWKNQQSFSIERPNLIYDRQLLDIKIDGDLTQDLRISNTKRYISLEFKCKYYVPQVTTTVGIMIKIPGYDDYAVYFFGLCDIDSSLPHAPRYDNPINAKNVDLLDKKPLIVEPKFIYEKTQDNDTEQLSHAKMAEDPEGTAVPIESKQNVMSDYLRYSGINDIEIGKAKSESAPSSQKTNIQQSEYDFKDSALVAIFNKLYEYTKIGIVFGFVVAAIYIIVQGLKFPEEFKKRFGMFIEQEQKYAPISANGIVDDEVDKSDDEDNAL